MPKVSKNARTSKKPVMVIPKKEKVKKQFILIEIDKQVYAEIKENGLTHYGDKFIEDIFLRYGKPYIKILNN